MQDNLELSKENMLKRETVLSEYACKSKDGIYLKDDNEDLRPIFYRDIDRIIHSLGYTRYIDKTQVFPFAQNDHITHRVLHVQLVSKIGRTIGRSLGLNEDLIEAIALGHDIGHSPFGHKGENLLNEICKKENIGYFYHNCQSVRILKDIENINVSVQTLDGILAHNGEILKNKYEYNKNKTKEDFLDDLEKTFKIDHYSKEIVPMTLEGSVVRIADVIAYIGRDIEDAIKLGIINREEIPSEITKVIGDNNSHIVDNLIKDIIINSYGKPYLTFSPKIFNALIKLQDWNYKNIYLSEEATKNKEIIEKLFNELFYCYLNKIESNKIDNVNLLEYVNEHKQKNVKRMVIDYIAGQTDKFFLKECEENIKDFKMESLYNN